MTTQTSPPQTALSRLVVVLVALTLVTGPALAAGSVATTQERAGTTSVRLISDTTTIEQGSATTYDIVVTNASGGVGAAEGRIELSNAAVGTISDVSIDQSAGLTDVTITDDGRSASFRAALMDTADSGSVTIGTVRVRGAQAGDTDVLLSIAALSDESGTSYRTGASPDSSLTVTGTKSPVDLDIQSDRQTIEEGSTVEFDVTRADTDARVRATVTVAGTGYSTGVSGTVSVEITESMISDAGTVTAVASKASTDDERFLNDTVTLDDGTDEPTQEPPATPDSGPVISIEPAQSAIEPEEQQQLRLVARNVDAGVGAVSGTVRIQSADVAKITEIAPAGSPGIQNVSVGAGGASARLNMALMNTSETGPVDLVTLTVDGTAAGHTTITPNVSALGTTSGSSYSVSSTESATVTVGNTDGSQSPVDTATSTTVVVDLASMPNGFNKASVTITAPAGATITAVEPRLTTTNQFRIAGGGVGTNSVTAQNVDLAGNIGATEQTRALFEITFNSRPALDDLSVTVNNLRNDDGNTVSGDRITVSRGSSSVFATPLPGAGVDKPPTDPDGDGLYEDIDGDGESDFGDAVALSFVRSSQLDTDSIAALDFDGDGDLDTDDAISLAFQ